MQKIWTEIKKDKIIYLVGILSIIVIFNHHIFTGTPFVGTSDYTGQHLVFYKEFHRLINDGLPFWSWNFFTGLNFYASKGYYLIGDIFAYITLIFPTEELPNSMTYVLFFKYFISIILANGLLKRYNLSLSTRLIFSILFAFTAWSARFIEHPVFSSFYTLSPLIFIGIEDYLQLNKKKIFIIASFLLMLNNFYLYFMLSVFMPVYYLVRCFQLDQFETNNNFFLRILNLIKYYILGIMISFPITLPTIIFLSQSTRICNDLDEFSNWGINNISLFILNFLIPTLQSNHGLFRTSHYQFDQFGLYVGTMSLLILPHVFYIFNNKKQKIGFLILLALIPLLLISPKIGFIFHLSYSLRYTYIITLIIWLVAANIFEQKEQFDIRIILISFTIYLAAYLLLKLLLIPRVVNQLYGIVNASPFEASQLNIALIFAIILTIILIVKNKYLYKAIIGIVIVELLLLISPIHYETSPEDGSFIEVYNHLTDNPTLEEAYDYIKSIDDSFYRVKTDMESLYTNNYNLYFDIKGISMYDTMFQYSQTDFLKWMNLYPEEYWMIYIEYPTILELLNVDYYVVRNTMIEDNVFADGYFYSTFLTMNDEFSVYKFNHESHLAYTFNEYELFSNYNKYNLSQTDFYYESLGKLYEYIIVEDADKTKIDLDYYTSTDNFTQQGFDPVDYNNNYMQFEFELDNPQMMFFSISYDKGWTILDNNKEVDYYKVDGGFIGLPLGSGYHNITFKFTPNGLIAGILLAIASIIYLTVEFRFSTKNNV